MSYEVQFIDIGRGKKSWTQTFQQKPTELMIERAARKGGMLASRNVEALFDCEDAGLIVVGGFRPVGSFKVRSATGSAS